MAALLMLLVGLILILQWLEGRFALAAGLAGNWLQHKFGSSEASGFGGQFGVGLLLGAVWSPYVGPTLGAASLLAAQGQNLGEVAFAMLLFGLGVALPMLLIGLASWATLISWRRRTQANS